MRIHSDEFKRTKAGKIKDLTMGRQTLNRTLASVERSIEMGHVTLWGTAGPDNPHGNSLINKYFGPWLGENGDTVTINDAHNGLLPLAGSHEDNEIVFNTDPNNPGFSFTGTYLGLTVVRYVLGGSPIGEMQDFLVNYPESLTGQVARELGQENLLPEPRRESLFEFGVVLRNVIAFTDPDDSDSCQLLPEGEYLVLHDWNSNLINHADPVLES